MKNFGPLLLLNILTISFGFSQQTIASFNAPATVCINQPVNIVNTTTGQINSSYWSFCLGNPNTSPIPQNLGNIGSQLSTPVYYSIAKDGNDYYAFVSNNSPGTITRLFYGTSLLNTPTVTLLGNLGVLPTSLEDLHIEKENGNWYGIAVGGTGGAVCRIDFGNSLSNFPTAVNFGNIGGMSYPQRLQVFWSGGNCYAFTPNRNGSTITRLNFGNSLANTPTGVNLGNIGGLSTCDDLALIQFGGNWYGYIVNEGDNTITRLDFGTSLLNTPTGINLGNTGALNMPRGIDVYVECGGIKGLVVNRAGNDLLKMNFSGGPTGTVTTTSYGNIGNFSFPHSIERFRIGDTLFAMIPNVNNNTLTRIYFPGCSNSSVASSTLQTPPPVSYNQVGTYYINYIVNEGQITQSSYCQQVVVTNINAGITGTPKVCEGDTIKLFGSGISPYNWSGPSGFTSTLQNIVIPASNLSNIGSYTLHVGGTSGCSGVAIFSVNAVASPTLSVTNKTICAGTSAILTASGALAYLWSTSQSTNSIKVTPGTTTIYSVKGYNENCATTQTVEVKVIPCTSLGEEKSLLSFGIYPNPASDEINILSQQAETILLINSLGQLLKIVPVRANELETIDLTDCPNGIYFLIGTESNSHINEKLIINR